MNVTSTSIAVALAVVVVAIFFIVPGLSPFDLNPQPAATDTTQATLPTDNQQTATTTMPTDQLQVTDEVVGTGATAVAGDQVTVAYVGTLADGTVFDASANHPETVNGFPFTLGAGQVIAGWDQGVAGMKVGGKRMLVIPPSLAYGATGAGNVIPPNATLTFEVELLSVTPAQ